MGMIIAAPVDSFFAQGRRARLTESADAVWQNIDRDVRVALPENVRTVAAGNRAALEMLTVTTWGRYRADLDFTAGPVGTLTTAGTFNAALATDMLAIVPTGAPNAAYAFVNVMTPPIVTTIGFGAAAGGQQQVSITPPVTFTGSPEPARRAYFVSGAVSYVCDTVAGTVTRYNGYNIGAAQPILPAAFVGGQATLIATNVTACAFVIAPGSLNDNGGVVTVRYTITTPDGESMTLQHEARVENPA
jgi:MSHA biogenesis protein MshO